MITIRQGFPADIPSVVDLWVQMIKEIAPTWVPNIKVKQEIVNNLFVTGLYYLGLVEVDKKIIGFLDGIVYYDPSMSKKVGLAQDLFLLPEYRKTNIAFRLFNHVMNEAKRMGVEVIELQATPQRKEDYQKMGFTVDQFVMRRTI